MILMREKFEDTKGLIRICIFQKENRQYNGKRRTDNIMAKGEQTI
jgi:hypothetical protein